MEESVCDSRTRLVMLEADAAAWLESHPPSTDTSMLYHTLLALPFLFNMSKNYATYVFKNEQALKTAFCMGRKCQGLPLPLPRSQSECACADLSELDVEKIYLSGSARECTDVRIFAEEASDLDVMLQLGPVSVGGSDGHAGQCTGAADPCGATRRGLEVTQERTRQPGFVVLRHRQVESCQHVDPLPVDTGKVLRLMDSFRLQTTGRPSCQTGPSVNTTYPGVFGDCTSIDLVACVLCPIWPHEEFASRQRPSGFPGARLVERLCRTPAFLVPVGFKGSPTEEVEWRLSFSRHEYIAYRSMTEEQRLCLTTLKHCRAVVGEAAKPLKSYYLKTALLWLTESRPAEQWTLATMHDSLLLILRYLDVCLRRGYLPCYFWPEVNLLSSRSDAEIAELTAAVDELRRRLLPSTLALLADWLGEPAATLAQTLLVDCQWMSTQELNLMNYTKSLDDLMCGDPRSVMRLTELLLNGKLWPCGRLVTMPLCPALSLSFLASRSLTRSASRDQSGNEGTLSTIVSILELVMQAALQLQEPDSLEDSWMMEEFTEITGEG